MDNQIATDYSQPLMELFDADVVEAETIPCDFLCLKFLFGMARSYHRGKIIKHGDGIFTVGTLSADLQPSTPAIGTPRTQFFPAD